MSEQNHADENRTDTAGREQDSHRGDRSACCRHGLGRRLRFGLGAAVLLLMGAVTGAGMVVAWQAHAADGAPMWMGHPGWHRCHGATLSLEQAQEMAVRKSRWIAAMIDATPEQETRVAELGAELVDEIHPLREQHRAHRQTLVDLLLSADSTRADIESVRQAELSVSGG